MVDKLHPTMDSLSRRALLRRFAAGALLTAGPLTVRRAYASETPLATLPAALVWVVVALTFRYVSLASLTAAVCLPLGALLLGYPAHSFLAAVGAVLIVTVRHRDNLVRLHAGTERKLGERASPS